MFDSPFESESVLMPEHVPESQRELAGFVAENARGERHALYPVGGRSKIHFGYPPRIRGTTISMARLCSTVDYPARDMTVTVEAGMKVGDLISLLSSKRQRLPVDVPNSQQATLGGAVATNVSGPRRFGNGTLRDYVIGVTAVDSQGRLFHGGGRVVKNVAGYDLCKLLVGSYGTLAVISQLTFKVRPMAETAALTWTTFDTLAAIDSTLERLTTSGTRPVCLDVLDPGAARRVAGAAGADLLADNLVLCVGFEGPARETEWQVARLKDELMDHPVRESVVITENAAERVWGALTEFQALTHDPLTIQASLLPSRTIEFFRMVRDVGFTVQSHAGNGIVKAHLPGEDVTVDRAEAILSPLCTFALGCRGSLTILNCEDTWKDRLPLFTAPNDSRGVMHKLKRALDPQNLLNPFRFIDGALA